MLKDNEISALKNEASKAKIEGNTDKAIECLERVYDLVPDDPNNAKDLGSLYNKLGNKKKAVEFYWKSLEKYRDAEYYQNATAIAQMLLRFEEDELLVKHELAFLYEKQGLLGDAVSAYEELAELYKKEGDIEGVLENLKKIVNITPKKLGIRLKLAEIYENQGKHEEAISELEEIKGIFQEQGRVEEVEEIESRIQFLASGAGGVVKEKKKGKKTKEEVKERVVPEEIKIEFEQEGIGLLEAVEQEVLNTEEELEVIEKPVLESSEGLFDMEEEGEEEEPEEPELVERISDTEKGDIEVAVSGWEDWINLAELYESVGSIEESLEYYNKAAEVNFNKKNYDESYDIYRRIADLDSLSIISRQKMIQSALKLNSREKAVESYFFLYECLEKKDAHSEAKKILEKIEKVDPNSSILEKVRGKKKKGKAEKEKVKEKLDFDGLFEEEVVSEGMFLKDETEEAEEKVPTLDTLLADFKKKAKEELDVTDYAAHFNLGITYKGMDLIEEAMEEFKKAMREKSWRLKSLEMLGLCHELLGQNEKAEDIYKIVINTDNFLENEKTAFFYHLGNLYARQGTYENALKQYKKAAQIDRDFADVNKKIELINKKMAGEEVEEELSFAFEDALLEEGADLWDSVVSGETKAEKPQKKEAVKTTGKKSGKISYI